jgi:lysozyme
MRTSQKGITLIKHFEQLHDGDLHVIGLQPKQDPIGIWTVGWGRALRDPKTGDFLRGLKDKDKAYAMYPSLTEEEAEQMLQEDLRYMEQVVMRKVTRNLQQHEFDALVSHTCNTGGSTGLFARASRDNLEDTLNWFRTKYVTGGGKKLPGLVRRSRAEAHLYGTGKLNFN